MKEIGKPEKTLSKGREEEKMAQEGDMWEFWRMEAIGKERAECQICEGSGGRWGFGWDVNQLLFTKISHQRGQSKKPVKTRRKHKSTGIRTDDMLHFNNCTFLAWEQEVLNYFFTYN